MSIQTKFVIPEKESYPGEKEDYERLYDYVEQALDEDGVYKPFGQIFKNYNKHIREKEGFL